jgi:flagellar basal-body rod modification protein FlgD
MQNQNFISNNIWPNYASENTSVAKQKGDQSLGKDDFLKILIAQLKHQDPMEPLDDKAFIAQMAQFSSVEQIQQMTNELKLMRQTMGISSDLIGKMVSWEKQSLIDGKSYLELGMVDSIVLNGGLQYVSIQGKQIPIDKLIEIWMEEGLPNE